MLKLLKVGNQNRHTRVQQTSPRKVAQPYHKKIVRSTFPVEREHKQQKAPKSMPLKSVKQKRKLRRKYKPREKCIYHQVKVFGTSSFFKLHPARIMPELGVRVGSTRQQVPAQDRKPDYFIGSSGLPTVTTQQSVKMHRSSTASNDGVRNSKLNKCLYNIEVRNGAARGAVDGGSSNSRRSCKTESDIMTTKTFTTGRYSKSPSPSAVRESLSSPASGCTLRFGNADPGRAAGSPSGWSSSMTSNSWRSAASADGVASNRSTGPSPPPRLLRIRSGTQRTTSSTTTTTSSNRSQGGGLMAPQHCRYSNLHKQLDNRLSYQRSYDRNIFGLDQRMDQFVLPPLQI